MSWVALLLIGVGITDLVFSARPMRWLPEVIGAAGVVGLGLAAGLTSPRDLVALAVLVLVVLGWGRLVPIGFGGGARRAARAPRTPRAAGAAWWPLGWLMCWLALALVLAPWAGTGDGLLGRWVQAGGGAVWHLDSVDRLLLVGGAFLVQLSTGNVVVRLVLRATGTLSPNRGTGSQEVQRVRLLEGPAHSLKGGRLLGPMERVFILGLGLTGQFTAAGIVVAAKGLLRFPELQAARDSSRGPGIHAVTEYFLVGSFASWLIALAAVALLG